MTSKGMRSRAQWLTFLITGLLGAQIIGQIAVAGTLQGKYNPGHYIAMSRGDPLQAQLDAARPGVVGFQQRYYWGELEKSWGVYDFSIIQKDLDAAHSQGRQLVVLLADKTFNGDKPLPPYAQGADYMVANRANGYTALRWQPKVVNRMKALVNQIGKRFDSHPAFEGIAFQETSLSINGPVLDANGYTPQKYRDAMIDILLTAASAMPNSRVFWYMNFLIRNQDYLAEVAAAVAPAGVIMGGPDVLPDEGSLARMTYPLFDQFQGKMPLFNSVQFDSYSAVHKTSGYSTYYWTMPELFNYAKNQLHVNYLFWSRKAHKTPTNSYNINNAYSVIANNPTFNGNWGSGGGTGTSGLDADGDGLSDAREAKWGTDPNNPDTDGDQLQDGPEVNLGTKPHKPDSDWDGLLDGEEVRLGTDPLDMDTDNGGVNDKQELDQGTDPLKAWDDGQISTVKDSDGDGLSDALEASWGTDPNNPDSDGDLLKDGAEVELGTKPNRKDTDWDGLIDGREVQLGTDPLDMDTDNGGVNDKQEVNRGTNPLKAWDD
jgi:hypothetical protein